MVEDKMKKYCNCCKTRLTLNKNWSEALRKQRQYMCKTCINKRAREYTANHLEITRKRGRDNYYKHREQYLKIDRQKYKKRAQISHNLKTNGCAICGYDKCTECLDFHHVNPRDKKFTVNVHGVKGKDKDIVEEINKCILLCKNCHGEIHYKEKNQR